MNFRKSVAMVNRWLADGRLVKSLWTKVKPNFGVYDVITDLGNVSDPRAVPEHVIAPSYAETGYVDDEPDQDSPPEIHSKERVELLRQSCKLARFVLNEAGRMITVGTTTDQIDCFVHEMIIGHNAYPSPLNYKGFLKSVCTSVNNVVCHGVPDDRPLRDGDLVSVDVSVYLHGVHGDCAATYPVGNVDSRGKTLMTVAQQCMYKGIKACGPSKSFEDIAKAVEQFSYQNGHNVVPSITGHGISTYFHGPPVIFHSSLYHYPGIMKPGMVFTVEPVICQGSREVEILEDGWSIVTMDNARGAQFEHTILITESGYEILTI